MRHDVKLGFAVGGILLAVLIVYVSVVGRNAIKPNTVRSGNDATVVASSSGASTSGTTSTTVTPAVAPKIETPTAPVAPTVTELPVATPAVDTTVSTTKTPSPNDVFESPKTDAASNNQTWDKLMAHGPSALTSTTDKPAATTVVPPVTETGPAVTLTPPVASADNMHEVTTAMTSSGFADAVGPAPRTSESRSSAVGSDSASIRPVIADVAAGSSYTIRSGDTFAKIAERTYGTQAAIAAIIKANPNVDPHHLKINQKITLPPTSEVKHSTTPAATASTSERAVGANEYRVGKEDSLYKIAIKLYGKGAMSDKIYELNKSIIGENPAKLKVGMILKLPAGAKSN